MYLVEIVAGTQWRKEPWAAIKGKNSEGAFRLQAPEPSDPCPPWGALPADALPASLSNIITSQVCIRQVLHQAWCHRCKARLVLDPYVASRLNVFERCLFSTAPNDAAPAPALGTPSSSPAPCRRHQNQVSHKNRPGSLGPGGAARGRRRSAGQFCAVGPRPCRSRRPRDNPGQPGVAASRRFAAWPRAVPRRSILGATIRQD